MIIIINQENQDSKSITKRMVMAQSKVVYLLFEKAMMRGLLTIWEGDDEIEWFEWESEKCLRFHGAFSKS